MDQMLILTSFTLSCIIIIISQKYFLYNNYIDKIKTRSSHSSIATRTGGVSLFSTLFLISIYFYLIGYDIYEFSLLIPLAILAAVGLYDDINGVDFKLKFIFQIIAAKIIIDNGLIIDNLHGFAGIYEISRITAQLLTVFVIVAVINSINFIDGIDGLAISNVILKGSDNKKLKSEQLIWDKNENLVYTESEITIQTGDEIISGVGFTSNPDFTEYEIKQAKGIFSLEK